MKQVGIILEVNENRAIVQIKRASACGEKCGQCGGCETTLSKVEAINEAGAKIGETVIMELDDSNVLLAAFIMYMVPVIILFVGIGIGYVLLSNLSGAAIIGLIAMVLSFLILKKLDRLFLKSGRFIPKITKITS